MADLGGNHGFLAALDRVHEVLFLREERERHIAGPGFPAQEFLVRCGEGGLRTLGWCDVQRSWMLVGPVYHFMAFRGMGELRKCLDELLMPGVAVPTQNSLRQSETTLNARSACRAAKASGNLAPFAKHE